MTHKIFLTKQDKNKTKQDKNKTKQGKTSQKQGKTRQNKMILTIFSLKKKVWVEHAVKVFVERSTQRTLEGAILGNVLGCRGVVEALKHTLGSEAHIRF